MFRPYAGGNSLTCVLSTSKRPMAYSDAVAAQARRCHIARVLTTRMCSRAAWAA
jgi:hypothetical protein